MPEFIKNLLAAKSLWGVPYLNFGILLPVAALALYLAFSILRLVLRILYASLHGHVGVVSSVADGDTFKVKVIQIFSKRGSKRGLTVRMIGLDTPESLKSPNKEIMPFGKDSSNYSKKRLVGKWVILHHDVDTIDQYGRDLCYVYFFWSGEFYNATLIKKGYAWAYKYPPNVKHSERFEQLQEKAKSAKRGLWTIYESRNVLRSEYKKSSAYKKFQEKSTK
ncbi:MAG: hypothetical protein EAZ57_00070 [Cytophagales bacterium]|nr:MAG: hypothetical protein EAZ67_04595 [Cytophagales bacterium]TAF62532.1 MAG: hypothetical protein EAZ57_00070 [Cytophagales bacterium]